MRNRINSAVAAALAAASGVSLSALLLLIYLRLRSNRGGNAQQPSIVDKPKEEAEATAVDEVAIVATVIQGQSQFNAEAHFEAELSLEEELTSSSSRSSRSPDLQVAAAEAAEESLSECENQLEEEEVQGKVAPAEPEEEVEEFVSQETEGEPTEETIMSAASAFLDEGVASSNSNSSNNNNNNNNNDTLVDKNVGMEATAGITVDTEAALAAEDGVGGGHPRVASWLAKNEPYCCQHNQQQQQQQQQQQLLLAEDASEDSGRPSSVDTAGGGGCSPSAAVAVATAAAATCGDSLTNGDGVGCKLPVIRGVSPIPGDDNDVIHQFLIANKLGGSMVGTRGRNINYIRAKSGASVWISRNFFDKKTQVVNVRGPVECVKAALQVIKKRFPELDVKPINTAVPIQRNPALQPTMCQLSLPVGALVDANVCAMCRGTTVFLQQPTHPSFHHLEKMDYTIMKHYADQEAVPALPRPVNPGAVCVAPFGSAWYRAIIADVYPEEDMVLMKYLDWGGYERMPVGCLKQIRTEMMHLPFQAVEGHLAYVSPVLSADEETEPQLERLSRLLHERYLSGPGLRVKCQVVYFNDVGQPCVYLYTRRAGDSGGDEGSEEWRFLQEELVAAGLAQWFQMPHQPPHMPPQQQSQQQQQQQR